MYETGYYWCRVSYETGERMELLHYTAAEGFTDASVWHRFLGQPVASYRVHRISRVLPPEAKP